MLRVKSFTTGTAGVEDLGLLLILTAILYRENISSRFTINSEALASELLENREEMLP